MTTATYRAPKPSGIRNVQPGDTDWFIHCADGLMMYPRASWQINQECPDNVRKILIEAMHNNWINIVANVYERELTWEKLNETE